MDIGKPHEARIRENRRIKGDIVYLSGKIHEIEFCSARRRTCLHGRAGILIIKEIIVDRSDERESCGYGEYDVAFREVHKILLKPIDADSEVVFIGTAIPWRNLQINYIERTKAFFETREERAELRIRSCRFNRELYGIDRAR